MQQITAPELKAWLDQPERKPPLLLDVREAWEFNVCHIAGSMHIPMHAVPARREEFARDHEIVAICHHGGRSFQVAMFLERMGHAKLYNLEGGVDAWARQVDPAMATY